MVIYHLSLIHHIEMSDTIDHIARDAFYYLIYLHEIKEFGRVSYKCLVFSFEVRNFGYQIYIKKCFQNTV